MDNFFVGTSGFSYQHWQGTFYPEKLASDQRLAYYAQHFNSVEINSSFYHWPMPSSIQKWQQTVPDDFAFSFKVSRRITQAKTVDLTVMTTFFERFSALDRSVKTIMLFQLPASYEINPDWLSSILELTPKHFLTAFEFRHPTWFKEDTYDILERYGAALVLADSPKTKNQQPVWPMVDRNTGPTSYLRFHGSEQLYASSYTDQELRSYARLIQQKLKDGRTVYAYFNNDIHGHAITNAGKLKQLVLGI